MNDVRPITLSALHKNTCNIFTNSMLIQAEKLILKCADYNLLFRDRLIEDRVNLYLSAVKNLINQNYFENLQQ